MAGVYDITRQKGCIIESLLKSFGDWIYSCLGVLGMPACQRERKYPNFDKQVSRNVAHGIHSWYQNYINKYFCAILVYLVTMMPEIDSERFVPVEHSFICYGFNFCPTLVSITSIEGENTKYSMNLSIKCSGSIAGIRFVVGVVLANKDYDIPNIFFCSLFACNFLRWSDVYAFDKNNIVLDYWTVSKNFIDNANVHGLYVCLLPVTYVEFDKLQNMRFLCGRCGQHYSLITAGHTCSNF